MGKRWNIHGQRRGSHFILGCSDCLASKRFALWHVSPTSLSTSGSTVLVSTLQAVWNLRASSLAYLQANTRRLSRAAIAVECLVLLLDVECAVLGGDLVVGGCSDGWFLVVGKVEGKSLGWMVVGLVDS